jgi:Ca-activated chloride channel family protein
MAKEYGIKVYTIALGTDKNAKIPVNGGFFGTSYQLIPGGSIDTKTLDQISKLTNAKMYMAQTSKALENILAEFIVFSLYQWRINSKFFQWVQLHWFYKKSKKQAFGNFLYIVGMGLLLVSLMDLRGRESKIKSNIPDQKTIILIDSSSSMLVEDVRPNRFQKALLLARHFVKEAPGNQIAIMLFSDFQKSFVPFTNDVDLLDARISGLSSLNITKGGSNLSQALTEAVQYFQESTQDPRKIVGNILVFSDAEETSEGFDLKIPEGISVAMVGVGTAKGGTIPLRDGRNIYYGNKTFNGQEVVSKLDESFMRSLSSKIKNYHFWVASSFTLPTKEILDFFTKEHKKKFSQGDVSFKPVLMEWILIPGIIILILSYLFKIQKSFVYLFVFCFLTTNFNLYAQDEDQRPKLEKAELDLMDSIAQGKAQRVEKLKLADLLMRKKYFEQAHILFEENLGELRKIEEVPLHINYATNLINLNDLEGGISHYYEVSKYLNNIDTDESAKWLEVIRQNTILAFNQQGKSDKSKNDKNSDKNNKNDNSQSDKDSQSGQNQDNQQKNQNGKAGDENEQKKNQNKPRDPKDLDKDQNPKDKKEKNEKDSKNEDQSKKENKNESDDQKKEENKVPQKKLKVKLPAQLKQLMNDDRSLQEKLLDTSTSEKFKTKENKDW